MTRSVILTHSGRLVGPGEGHPSLHDIARGLSLQPRFGGQTDESWSVLEHSMFCAELADSIYGERTFRLAMLLHDAHEAITGDVPTPLKTPDFRAMQDALDERIMDAYFPGGYAAYRERKAQVAYVDRRAMQAEAQELLPHDAVRTVELFGEPYVVDVEVLRRRRPWGRADYVQAVVDLL
jgi:5'-deoxynucleotidase YfbR-like HD superfamily hydrolase